MLHSEDKHQSEFNNCLVEFIGKMLIIISDEKQRKSFKKYYKYYRKYIDENNRTEFIREFIGLLDKYRTEVSISDEGLFSDEFQYYPQQPIYLLHCIDFKNLWKGNTFSAETKTSIWQYIHTLYILGNAIINVDHQSECVKQMIRGLKMSKKIKEEAMKQAEIEKLEEESDKIDFKSIFEIFGEDNSITKIVIEIAKEMDLATTIRDPTQIFTALFGGQSDQLKSIVDKISAKIADKMATSGITEEQLTQDAQRLQERLMSKFKGIPGIGNIETIGQKLYDYIKQAQQTATTSSSSSTATDSTATTASVTDPMDFDIQVEFDNLCEHIVKLDPTIDLEQIRSLINTKD